MKYAMNPLSNILRGNPIRKMILTEMMVLQDQLNEHEMMVDQLINNEGCVEWNQYLSEILEWLNDGEQINFVKWQYPMDLSIEDLENESQNI